MEPIKLFTDLFGVPIDTVLMVGAFVYFLVEAVKKRLPDVFKGGAKTFLVAGVLSFALCYKAFYPNWETVIAGTVFVWLFSEGIHAKSSNGGTQ